MAEQYWRLQRARNQEYDALAISTGSDDELKRLVLLDRYATRHERSFHKCLNTLRKIQQERRAKADEDFVSQKRAEPAQPASISFVPTEQEAFVGLPSIASTSEELNHAPNPFVNSAD